MTEIKDPFTAYEDVNCRDGVTRRIYPAKLKHKDQIRKLTPLFNDFAIIDNIFSFDTEPASGGFDYTDTAWNAMLDILVLAFDEKYTREEIENFLDLALVRQVFAVFYDISSLKKKNLTPMPA